MQVEKGGLDSLLLEIADDDDMSSVEIDDGSEDKPKAPVAAPAP